MFRSIKNLALFGTGTVFGSLLTVFVTLRFIFTNRHTKAPAKEIVSDVISGVLQIAIFNDIPGYRPRRPDYQRYASRPMREATPVTEETIIDA